MLRLRNSLGHYGSTVDDLACKSGVESRAEGVLTEDTNSERLASGCRSRRGPLDESAEVEQVNRLHLVLGGFGALRQQPGDAGQRTRHSQYAERLSHYRHVIAAYALRLIPPRTPASPPTPPCSASPH